MTPPTALPRSSPKPMRQNFIGTNTDVTDDFAELAQSPSLRFVIVDRFQQTGGNALSFMALDGANYSLRDAGDFLTRFTALRDVNGVTLYHHNDIVDAADTFARVARDLATCRDRTRMRAYDALYPLMTPDERGEAESYDPYFWTPADYSNDLMALQNP